MFWFTLWGNSLVTTKVGIMSFAFVSGMYDNVVLRISTNHHRAKQLNKRNMILSTTVLGVKEKGIIP